MGALHRRTATDLTRILWVLFALRIGKLASSCSQNLLSLESAVWKISCVVLKKDDKFFMGHRARAILFFPHALRRLQQRAALRQDSVMWPSSRRSLPTELELVGRFRRGPARFKINIQQASAVKTTNGVFINDVVKLDEEFPGGELFYAFMDPWS